MPEQSEVDLSEFITETKCPVGRLSLTVLQSEKLAAALFSDPAIISNVAIIRVLANWGHVVKKTAMSEHRKGDCICV
jgi:hypothetical protein